jgi:hypothetical protein
MAEKKGIALSTKLILAGFVVYPAILFGLMIYSKRVELGDDASKAFEAGASATLTLLVVAFYVGIFLYGLLLEDERLNNKSKS